MSGKFWRFWRFYFELTTWCLWVVLKNVSRSSLPRNLQMGQTADCWVGAVAEWAGAWAVWAGPTSAACCS